MAVDIYGTQDDVGPADQVLQGAFSTVVPSIVIFEFAAHIFHQVPVNGAQFGDTADEQHAPFT